MDVGSATNSGQPRLFRGGVGNNAGAFYSLPGGGSLERLDAVRFALALPRPARVELRVQDVQGRMVATQEDRLEAGYPSLTWDGRDASGRRARAGVYFVTLRVEGQPAGQRRIVLRD